MTRFSQSQLGNYKDGLSTKETSALSDYKMTQQLPMLASSYQKLALFYRLYEQDQQWQLLSLDP